MNPRGRGLVENEEQGKNKRMKLIVVEEQEQDEGSESESETGFVDLDPDTLHNVLKRVDVVTLGRAACVNRLWFKEARDKRLWWPIALRLCTSSGRLEFVDTLRDLTRRVSFCQPWPMISGMFADDSRTDKSVFWLVDSHPDAPVAAVLCALYT